MCDEQHVLGHLYLPEGLEQLLDDVQQHGVVVAYTAVEPSACAVRLARAVLQRLQVLPGSHQRL